MGALAHFIEAEGIATTQISLIRIHTEKINPSRALWVPFELGRPLGAPKEPDFQIKVIRAALGLLEASTGPVLEDFPEEAPVISDDDETVLACPYVPGGKERPNNLCEDFAMEINSLKPWYFEARRQGEEEEFGASKLCIDEIAKMFTSILHENEITLDETEVPVHHLLRFAADDLKAFYYVAMSAQPGSDKMKGEALETWFWIETVAGNVLRKVREHCLTYTDKQWCKGTANALVPARFLD